MGTADDAALRRGRCPAQHYTQIPNIVLDSLIPALGGVEARVLLYLCRQVYGWHREEARASLAAIARDAGISRAGASVALAHLEAVGLIQRCRDGQDGQVIALHIPEEPPYWAVRG